MVNIDELIKQALKSQNKTELRAYRNLKAEFLKAETAKNAKPIDEAAEIGIIKKYCDKLSQSIEQFQKAHRQDLAFEYISEREVLRKLLPEPVNESQIYSELYNYGLTVGWSKYVVPNPEIRAGNCIVQIPKKEMGNAIKHLKARFPQADGKMISEIVKKYIV